MRSRKIISCALFIVCISLTADLVYAQSWRDWFQKKQTSQEPAVLEKSDDTKAENTQQQTAVQETSQPLGQKKEVDVEIWTIDEPKDTAEQALSEAEKEASQPAPAQPKAATEEIDEKTREEALRRTQEQVDHIKRMQEMNSVQRSLDSTKRINEMNQQQKRIDEINRLNRMQKNLDSLRRSEEIKK